MNTKTDLETLAQKVQEGDQEAFGLIYDATFDFVYKYIFFRVRDPEDAKDLTHQIYIEIWKNIGNFNPNRKFKPWIFGFVKFRLIDHYRRYRPTTPLESVTEIGDYTDLEQDTASRLEVDKIQSAILALPEPYQTAIQLRYIQELDYSEIAQITGKKENNLRIIVKRGLEKLRQSLD